MSEPTPMTPERRAEIEATVEGPIGYLYYRDQRGITLHPVESHVIDLLTELRRVEGLLAERDAAWRRVLWCTVIDLHAEANVASRAGQYDRLKKIAKALAAKEPTP